ncbi:hypothetical protein C8F01DRAFT_696228 [Mycena amicta]|nr:hypothetical protein C8F01DRAFT_696228 [Mycena amicta]
MGFLHSINGGSAVVWNSVTGRISTAGARPAFHLLPNNQPTTSMDKNEDSESQPLLGDLEAQIGTGNAEAERPVHVCARCASEIRAEHPNDGVRVPARTALIWIASVFSTTLFILSIVVMALSYRFYAGELFVCLWAFTTQTVLFALLYAGWPRRRRPLPKLSKATAQIKVLCLLAFSWMPLATGAIVESHQACTWGYLCGAFVWVDLLIWFLMIVLFGAAFATYRRAVKIHGKELVQNPNKIPAWRLSEVNGVEGAVKL